MQTLEKTGAEARPSSNETPKTAPSSTHGGGNGAPEPQTQAAPVPRQTACPACTLVIDITTTSCPHCSSNVSAHMALFREKAREERANRSLRDKVAGYFANPGARREFRIVAPSLILFVALIGSLQFAVEPLVFWLSAPLAGILGFLLLKRSSYQRTVKVDLYRTALVIALAGLLGSALL